MEVPREITEALDEPITENQVNVLEHTCMGDDDIKHFFPNARIFTYPQLKIYKSIDELIPDHKDYFILLFLETENSGHWTLVANNNNTIEFFCSYGSSPSAPLKWNKDRNKELGITSPYLDNLLNSTEKQVIYNPIDYQDNKDLTISTCGRHCCFRLMCLLKYDLDLNEYYQMLQQIKEEEEQPYDEIVSELINEL